MKEEVTMIPDELTEEQKGELINKRAYAMEIRVLCTADQLDALNDALDKAGQDHAIFVVHHTTEDPSESDVEEALAVPFDVKWGKLGEP